MCSTAYISSSGTVTRERQRYEVSRPRVVFVMALLIILFVTNPANNVNDWQMALLPVLGSSTGSSRQDEGSWYQQKYNAQDDAGADYSSGTFSSSLLQSAASMMDSFLSSVQSAVEGKRVTNYVLFSLRNDPYDGIYIQALSNDSLLCRYDGNDRFDPLCEWVEDHFCHGMSFDRNNRPFVAHRIFEFILIASAVSMWCLKPGWLPPEPCWRKPFATIASVFWFPSLFQDLFVCNVLVYPALVKMDRLVSITASSEGVATRRFFFSVVALLFGIGGLSNLVATLMMRSANFGIHGATAASLGYLLATAPGKVILRGMGFINMYAADVLMAVTVIGLIDSLFSIRLPVLGGIGSHSVLTWMLGGVLGNMMGQFQLERYTAWWYPFRQG